MPYKNVPKKKLSLWFKFSGDANVSVGKPKFFIKLTGSIELEHHRSYELPSNTILGYACYEVRFDPDMGTFELVLPDETDAGGEIGKKYCLFDEPDGQKGNYKELLLLNY